MNGDKLYEAVFVRKSVRKYDMTADQGETAKMIRHAVRELKPLYPEIAVEFDILDAGMVKGGMFGVIAPYYIAAYSEPREGDRMNIGFMLQQLDLLLSSEGVGCCWLGTAKPSNPPSNGNGKEFVIMMAAGVPAEPVHRASVSEFKRKALAQITDIRDLDKNPALRGILEAARLAPSATNGQPWFFSKTDGGIIVSRQALNPVKAMLYGKMNLIDIGIALCHIMLAAAHESKGIEFVSEKNAASAKGYTYCITARISG